LNFNGSFELLSFWVEPDHSVWTIKFTQFKLISNCLEEN